MSGKQKGACLFVVEKKREKMLCLICGIRKKSCTCNKRNTFLGVGTFFAEVFPAIDQGGALDAVHINVPILV